jgi:adenylate cyclase
VTEREPATTRVDESGLSVTQVAGRAGVETDFVERLIEFGILEPSPETGLSQGDVRRARIIHSIEQTGMSLELIGEASRRGQVDLGFINDPAYELFAGLSDTTFRAESQRTGIPLELMSTIREAMGSAQPGPDDRMRSMELEVVPALQLMLQNGVRPMVVERAIRSYGENVRRITEIEADWWRSDVMEPILASGGSMADIGPRTREFSNTFAHLSDQLLLALFHGNQSAAWLRNFFEGFETALERAGLQAAADRLPAICFLDLSGYTRLTEQRGDAAAADLAGRLARLVQRTSSQHGGRPVKWLGDGVMFHFRDPGRGVVAALEMVEGASNADLPPAHVGLHAGPVLFQEGDYFGRTVNVASRIADYARQGEVLVSNEVVAASGKVPGVEFDPIGPVELKGLTETVSLHVARRAT